MISTKTNHRPLTTIGLAATPASWRNSGPTGPASTEVTDTQAETGLQCLSVVRRTTELVHYCTLRVERTTTGEPVAMERYAAHDPMSAVEGARRLAVEGAGGVALLILDRDGASSALQEVIAIFGLRPEEAKRLLSTG